MFRRKSEEDRFLEDQIDTLINWAKRLRKHPTEATWMRLKTQLNHVESALIELAVLTEKKGKE